MRLGVAARAGALLVANALVVTGTTLAFSLRGPELGGIEAVIGMVALACVVMSVGSAALALVSLRSWERQFGDWSTPPAFLYCYAESGRISKTFEAFKQGVTAASTEEMLEFALAELWRCGLLHEYRYRKMRGAMFWLVAALIFFLVNASLSLPR